jgi:hypothetical protein
MRNELHWNAPEYIHREKGTDWYIALWVIIVAGAIASLLTSNSVFAAFLVICGLTFTALANRQPAVVEHEITNHHIRHGGSKIPYSAISGFWMFEKRGILYIRLSFKRGSHIKTLIVNPEEVEPNDVYDALVDRIEEREIELPFIERIVDIAGL